MIVRSMAMNGLLVRKGHLNGEPFRHAMIAVIPANRPRSFPSQRRQLVLRGAPRPQRFGIRLALAADHGHARRGSSLDACQPVSPRDRSAYTPIKSKNRSINASLSSRPRRVGTTRSMVVGISIRPSSAIADRSDGVTGHRCPDVVRHRSIA